LTASVAVKTGYDRQLYIYGIYSQLKQTVGKNPILASYMDNVQSLLNNPDAHHPSERVFSEKERIESDFKKRAVASSLQVYTPMVSDF